MSDTTTKLVQGFALGSSAYLAGYISSISLGSIRPLTRAPPMVAAQQWQEIYNVGKHTAPPIALLSLSAYGYLSWAAGGLANTKGALYAAAGTAVIAIVPFTLGVMLSTNNRLIAQTKEWESTALVSQSTLVQQQLDKWRVLNLIRSLGPAIGAGLGLVAVLWY